MRTALRLVGYTAALALAFGTAWNVGAVAGVPAWSVAEPAPDRSAGPPAPEPPPPAPAPRAEPAPLGLPATADGYTLVLPNPAFTPGRAGELVFTVTGPDGRPVRAFDVRSEAAMHVVVVRRDVAGFQRLLPTLGPDGLWRVPLVLPAPGIYRLYADFQPTGGAAQVLGTDLFAPGEFAPVPFVPDRVWQIDGYQVRLDGDLLAARPSQVFVTISRDGAAVTDLQPYLGAFGQLVALRRSDLGYVRLQPDAPPPAPTDRSGPGIAFTGQLPTPGSYRLFLEFRHGGGVHVAEFTVDTRDGA